MKLASGIRRRVTWKDVVIEVGVGRHAGEHADPSRIPVRIVPRGLERCTGLLQKQPLLRVDQSRFGWRVFEELMIEALDIQQHPLSQDEIRLPDECAARAARLEVARTES